MPCPRTARSRPMRHLPLAALATAVLGLSGCTWVHMAPGAKAVQVMATAPTGCEKRGEVSVSVADKVALVYERNDLRVREELETLARNEAPGIGADTISPLRQPMNDEQQFAAWRCRNCQFRPPPTAGGDPPAYHGCPIVRYPERSPRFYTTLPPPVHPTPPPP